jgi:hypothetical protein
MPTHRFAQPLLFALLLLVVPRAACAEDLIGLFLSWQQDPTTTMTVTWVDIYADSSPTILYRKYDGQKHTADTQWLTATAKQSTMGPTTLQLRRVELTGLEPDTRYEFGIGDATKDVTQFWRFDTMPANLTRPLTFVAGGDMMHSRAMVDDMNEEMQKLEPDFALLGGDIAYENGVHGTHWIDWLQSWTNHAVTKDKRLIPLVITIGNHEVKGGYNGTPPQDAPYFYSIFPLPENRSYYALDFGKYLSLMILDSQHTNPIAGPQAEWLAEAMSQRGDQQFLFACYHFPAYGTTKEPEGGTPIDSPQALAIQKNWCPSFERYGATAIFENDHHNYKRSHRIRNRQRDDANGILYLGDGAWGVEPRTVPKDAWWLAKAEGRNHLWRVELDPDGEAKFEAIDAKGDAFDEVEIKEPRTKPVP